MADISREIKVTASLEGEKFQFSMSGSGVGGPENEVIVFNKDQQKGMKKSDRYLVRFNLDDKTGQDLRFVKPKGNAMWAKVVTDVNEPCPKEGDHLQQFKADQVIDDALIVKNKDDDPELIKFALNFIRKNGDDKNPDEYVQYDPIGDNRNGGVPFIAANRIQVVLIAGISVVAIALTAIRVMSH